MKDEAKTKEHSVAEAQEVRLGVVQLESGGAEPHRNEEELRDRLEALPRPLVVLEDIAFEDLFNLDGLQHFQDLFADVWGVAALITRPDGTPVTRPSNFSDFCRQFIRKSSKGLANCLESDAIIDRPNPSGPIVRPCLGAGLYTSGAGIKVGGRHIANWKIGQVRRADQTDEQIVAYARELGVDEAEFLESLRTLPIMTRDKFEQIARALHTLANQLSTIAYHNVQQARFIAGQKRAQEELRKAHARLELRVQERTSELSIMNAALVAEVAERKRIAEVLSNREATLRGIFDAARESIWMFDTDMAVLTANEAAVKRLGIPMEELVGRPTDRFLPEELARARRSHLKKVVDSAQPLEFEDERSGILFHHCLYPIADAEGRIASVVCYSQDITEQKRSERALQESLERVRHLNDVLKAIREITSLLRRERDRQNLMNSVCECLLHTRGYVTVWIGEPDEDKGEIKSMAHAGPAADFQRHAPIRWDDSPYGQGPTGTALRERRPVVFDDLARDPRFAPWREPVVSAGAASIASVPLLHRDRLFGVITVKADRINAFDSDEIELLNGLAQEVAHTLQALEDEREREKAYEALRESEQKYRALFEAESDAIILVENDTDFILEANSAASALFGYTREEFLVRKNSHLSQDPEKTRTVMEESKASQGRVVTLSLHYLEKKDGTVFPAEITARSFSWQKRWVHIAAIRDITERKQAEKLLRIERDLAIELGSAGGQVEAMRCIVKACLRFDGLDAAGVYLVDRETGALKLVYHEGLSNRTFIEAVSYFEPSSPQALFVSRGEPGYWSRPTDLFESGDLLEREGLLALVVIPVKHNGEAVASLNLASHAQPVIDRNVRHALEVIAAHIGGTVSRIRLGETIMVQRERLQESNTALKVLLKQREDDRAELEESFLENVNRLVLPYHEKLMKSRPSESQKVYLEIMESHLKEITSPFVRRLSSRFLGLTPAEIRVADLIRTGKTSKEIAELLGASEKTILAHRRGIRDKLNLKQKKVNLQAYLMHLDD